MCGFAAFVPVPGLRGALFGLFPGLAFRDPRLAVKGAELGFAADVLFCMAWACLHWQWELRGDYNRTLARIVPPGHWVGTHHGCPVPNWLQFALGLVAWATVMFLVWSLVWPRKFGYRAYFLPPAAGAVLTAIAAVVLWTFAPMNDRFGWPPAPPYKLQTEAFVALLIASLPLCTLGVGLVFWILERTNAPPQPRIPE
jgi:hypothetical protein